MSLSCGKWLSSRISGRLETSTSLTYANGMSCDVTISVSDNKRMLAVFNRFEVEDPISGVCPDYLTVYDGLSTSSPTIIEKKCGTEVEPFGFNTSTNHVTFRFISDATAVFRGFEVEYTEFTEGSNSNNNNDDNDNNDSAITIIMTTMMMKMMKQY